MTELNLQQYFQLNHVQEPSWYIWNEEMWNNRWCHWTVLRLVRGNRHWIYYSSKVNKTSYNIQLDISTLIMPLNIQSMVSSQLWLAIKSTTSEAGACKPYRAYFSMDLDFTNLLSWIVVQSGHAQCMHVIDDQFFTNCVRHNLLAEWNSVISEIWIPPKILTPYMARYTTYTSNY